MDVHRSFVKPGNRRQRWETEVMLTVAVAVTLRMTPLAVADTGGEAESARASVVVVAGVLMEVK